MHQGLWEIVANTLFWMQLFWVLSGFGLMAYFAFKVFPGKPELGSGDKEQSHPGVVRFTKNDICDSGRRREPFLADHDWLDPFPPNRAASGAGVKLSCAVSEENGRPT